MPKIDRFRDYVYGHDRGNTKEVRGGLAITKDDEALTSAVQKHTFAARALSSDQSLTKGFVMDARPGRQAVS